MNDFLSLEVCDKFREAINSANFFKEDEKYSADFNLYCVVVDRLDSNIKYLNNQPNEPTTEEEFIIFIMFSCMVLDAVTSLKEVLNFKDKYENDSDAEAYQFFKDTCMREPLNISKEKCPTDDKFFQYLRSLIMAHPFKTSRAKFLEGKEVQYSPFVIAGRALNFHGENNVGVCIYSNRTGDKYLRFNFKTLKNYINSRFLLINEATERIYQIIRDKHLEWELDSLTLQTDGLNDGDILELVINILKKRSEFFLADALQDFLDMLWVSISNKKNDRLVKKYKDFILSHVSRLFEAVKVVDHDTVEDIIKSICDVKPKKMHDRAHYQLKKIFSNNDQHWSLEQAKLFSRGFAKNWIMIDINTMKIDEVRVLVRTACYLEKIDQENP